MPTTTTLLLLLLLATFTNTSSDHYLLSCGALPSVSNSPSTYDNQIWYTDNNSTFSNNFSSTISTPSTSPEVPFSTARIFTANFTYSFPVSPGPKFIRLFFYSPNSSDSYLTLQSSTNHLLLRNFSAYATTTPKVSREFYVHVDTSPLQLSFYPTPPSTRAFINGIEIISVPDTLYVGPTDPTDVAQSENPFPLSSSTALETAYRLNVGGNELGPTEDTGMGRRWAMDEAYLRYFVGSTGYADNTRIKYTVETPNYTAPDLVYETFRWIGKDASEEEKKKVNVTWEFKVDGGFWYMVRLHWCEVVEVYNASQFRIFSVYMDGMMAEREMDVFSWVGGDTPIYRDYVVYVDEGGSEGVLRLEMHPSTQKYSVYKDVLLNGLELFKISRSNGSLDAPNPIRSPTPSQTHPPSPPTNSNSTSHFILAISGAAAAIIALALILFLLCRRHRSKQLSTDTSKKTPSQSGFAALPSDLCRRFTISDIKRATSDFDDSNIIGRGGFGNVYKATLDDGIQVAIKRLNPQSRQGAHEFKAEIGFLSILRHVNLVSLVGFCDEAGEMALVYEYMTHGTLQDQLCHLSWIKRLEICIGAARGLHYLHEGTGRMIIHRDIKDTNILLDEKWVAKVSDFGLSRLGPTDVSCSHVSTGVKGTIGYLDPEYYKRQQLTEKSDVYSFGVVLFQVLCGRAVINNVLPKVEINLALWGRRNQVRGTLGDIVDPRLNGEIAPECLRKFGEVAESCVRDVGVERPCMEDVVGGLEFALRLQNEATTKDDGGWSLSTTVRKKLDVELGRLEDSSVARMTSTTSESSDYTNMKMSKSSSELFSGSSDQGYSDSTTVFSQIQNPGGR